MRLPSPTAVVSAFSPSTGTVLFYGATLVLCSGSPAVLAWFARRVPA
ncbi:hypothetical protein [Paractinoplanes ferrugineus]|nr:hypothetical protein [Actinoplanes ferrugineus]